MQLLGVSPFSLSPPIPPPPFFFPDPTQLIRSLIPSRVLQAGAHRVYITSRKASACHEAVKTLNSLPNLAEGAKAIAVPADISTIEGVESLVRQVKETTDVIDVLFANAGASWGEGFDTHPDAAFGKVMDLNVRSVFGCIRL